MFTFKINGTTVTNPLEWAEFTETLEYDSQVNGILMKYNQKFTFVKDGYEVISNYLDTNGYCNRLPLQVLYQCSDEPQQVILDGYIFLSEAKFNRSKCTVSVEFEDNSYTAKIFANRGIKTYLNGEKSKNGTTITPCQQIYIIMSNPFVGTLPTNFTRPGYDLEDVFRYLIDFMTDGTVGFVSDWLANIDYREHIMVSTGDLLRYTAAQHRVPNISFQETFEEIRKKFNIAFAVEKDSNGNPRIRIEPYDYFKNDVSQSIVVNNIPELMESFDSDMFYAQVNIGSHAMPLKNINPSQFALYPYPFVTFQEENYFIQGECNTDNELNLVSDWVIDHNIIQGLILTDTANTDYDEKTVLIQYQIILGVKTVSVWNDIDSAVLNRYYYNDIFRNNNVAARFNLQGNIVKYLGTAPPLFQAEKTVASAPVTYTSVVPGTTAFTDTYFDVPYQDDSTPPNNDLGGNYNNTTYRFKAPVGGLYTFTASTNVNITTNSLAGTGYWYIQQLEVYFLKYDSGGTLQNTILGRTNLYFPQFTPLLGKIYIKGGNSIFLLQGEEVAVQVVVKGTYYGSLNGATITYDLEGGFFNLISSINGGGNFGTQKDPDNYYTSVYEFEQVLSEADWNAIKANPQNYMRFSMDSNQGQKGWLRKIERNKQSGLTKFTLTSKRNNQ